MVSDPRFLVLAQLTGSDDWVARDVTDIDHPSTIANFGAGLAGGSPCPPATRFVAPAAAVALVNLCSVPGRLVYVQAGQAGEQTLAVAGEGAVFASFAASPDGSHWSMLLNHFPWAYWYLVDHDSATVIESRVLPFFESVGDLGTIENVTFSGSGSYVAMDEVNYLAIRDLSGRLVGEWDPCKGGCGANSNLVHDAIWAGEDLYFSTVSGIERWDGSTFKLALPGVHWTRPKLSPDGSMIAFHTDQRDGLPHIDVFEKKTQAVKQVSAGAGTEAWFLGGNYIWYKEGRPCESSTGCCCNSYVSTGRTFVIDLAAGKQAESRIAAIADTWPRPGGAAV